MIPVVNPMKAKGPLREGDPVIFLDRKDREYLFRLDRSHPISIRGGKISADEIIGQDEGSVVRSSLNEPFLVFRPSFPQLIPNLPRNAQIIYPKDIGPILVWADLFPGARVVEAGLGAGALSMALLRAIGNSLKFNSRAGKPSGLFDSRRENSSRANRSPTSCCSGSHRTERRLRVG